MLLKLFRNYKLGYRYSITSKDVSFYNENGFLILKDVISESNIRMLLNRADYLIESADIIQNQIYFTSQEKYQFGINFLDTASAIGYLLEEGMVKNNQLVVPNKKEALNKIGHAMHDIDPVFQKFSYTRNFMNILKGLQQIDPVLVQTMLIFKNKKTGTEYSMHADNTWITSTPRLSCTGLWVALEDANKMNGCLRAFPGSHKVPTSYFCKLTKDRRNTEYIGENPQYEKKYELKDSVCLEVPAGSVVVLHGDLVHFSEHNYSNISRHAYTMHFYDSGNGNKWSPDAWLQRKQELPFRKYYQTVEQIS